MILDVFLISLIALISPQQDVAGKSQSRDADPIKIVLPGYPWAARVAMTEASICVALEIDADGWVSRTSVLYQDVGHPQGNASVFTTDLLRAIKQWRYTRAVRERKTLLRVRYVFSLDPDRTGAIFSTPDTLELRGAVDPVDHPDHIIWKPGTTPRSPDLKRDPCGGLSSEKR